MHFTVKDVWLVRMAPPKVGSILLALYFSLRLLGAADISSRGGMG